MAVELGPVEDDESEKAWEAMQSAFADRVQQDAVQAMIALTEMVAVRPVRGLHLTEQYVTAARRLLAAVGGDYQPPEEGGANFGLGGAPLVFRGAGRMHQVGDAQETILREAIHFASQVTGAQSISSLTRAYETAREAGDDKLASLLKKKLEAALGEEISEGEEEEAAEVVQDGAERAEEEP